MPNYSPWEDPELEDDDVLLRRIPAFQREQDPKRKHKFPGPDHFALREDLDEDSLSFNFEKYATVDMSYILIGLTHDKDGCEFIHIEPYVFFKYPIRVLKSLPKFEKIEYSPNWYGCPSPVGRPNNKSHMSLYCGDFDIGTRAILSLYCQDNDSSYIKFKGFEDVRETLKELRERQNETPYHRDWVFD